MRVLVVEASSGGVVGGSLTGLYHMIRGFNRTRYEFGMVLYERKAIESDLARLPVPIFHVARRRLPKEHRWQQSESYRAVRSWQPLRQVMHASRTALATVLEDVPAAAALVRVMRRFRPDLVHAGNGLRANFDVLLACAFLRVPVVCHVKGFEKYGSRERWMAGRADAIVCMTEAVRHHCQSCGIVHPRQVVIYDALDPAEFQPRRPAADVRRELDVPLHALLVGVVGNIQEWKGQMVFVDALARLRERVPEAYGVIVGGVHRAGERYYHELLHRVQQAGVKAHLRITGFRSDVPDLVGAIDVLVHTSVRPEPFGRVILEGMLAGKAVVAAAAGGVPELVQPGITGVLVPPGDATALAEAVLALLREQATREAMGERAKQWVRERFGLQRHVTEFEALYRAVLEERQRT